LLKRMPWTGTTFLVGAVAICGLPPLNGFVSEFLIFLAAGYGIISSETPAAIAGVTVIGALALIGGLAAACFAKAFGIVFLGEPRSRHAEHAHECGLLMRWPMVALAAACAGIALLAPTVLRGLETVIGKLGRLPAETISAGLGNAGQILWNVIVVTIALIAVTAGLAGCHYFLLRRRKVTTAVTWDCGYAAPSARMQYTASSFAQPITELFKSLLGIHYRIERASGLFPVRASLTTHTPDVSHSSLFQPAFERINRTLGSLRWLQHGNVHLYVLYVAITLLILLIWKLR
jgi:NADH:ubiquinone oxidoreductase subunit 5 (subunit L)/multisubunit Na+/H+ antiporter MnhA subunit